MEGFPDLIHPAAGRTKVDVSNVVTSDLHVPLVEIVKAVTRAEITAQSKELSLSINRIEDMEAMLDLLKRRLRDVRLKINKDWGAGKEARAIERDASIRGAR